MLCIVEYGGSRESLCCTPPLCTTCKYSMVSVNVSEIMPFHLGYKSICWIIQITLFIGPNHLQKEIFASHTMFKNNIYSYYQFIRRTWLISHQIWLLFFLLGQQTWKEPSDHIPVSEKILSTSIDNKWRKCKNTLTIETSLSAMDIDCSKIM